MYAALWHVLPGPIVVRILILLVLAAATVAALFAWVFPWVLLMVSPLDATVQQ
jgi:hypothetical protein